MYRWTSSRPLLTNIMSRSEVFTVNILNHLTILTISQTKEDSADLKLTWSRICTMALKLWLQKRRSLVAVPSLQLLQLRRMFNADLILKNLSNWLVCQSSLRAQSLSFQKISQENFGISSRIVKMLMELLSRQQFFPAAKTSTQESVSMLALMILTLHLLLWWTRLLSNIMDMLRVHAMSATWTIPSYSAHHSLLRMQLWSILLASESDVTWQIILLDLELLESREMRLNRKLFKLATHLRANLLVHSTLLAPWLKNSSNSWLPITSFSRKEIDS